MLTLIPKKQLTNSLDPLDCRESFPPVPEPIAGPSREKGLNNKKGEHSDGEQDWNGPLTLGKGSPKEKREIKHNRQCSEQIVGVTKLANLNTSMQVVLEPRPTDPPLGSGSPIQSDSGEGDQNRRTSYSHIVSRGDDQISLLSPVSVLSSGVLTEQVSSDPQTSGGRGVKMMMGDLAKRETSSQSDSQSESPPTKNNANGEKHALVTCPEPTRHSRTSRKIYDWEIQISKPILIIGDSNLSRVSAV